MLKKVARCIDPEKYNPALIFPGTILNENTKIDEDLSPWKKAWFAFGEEKSGKKDKKYQVTKVFAKTDSYVIFEVNDSGSLDYITVDDRKFSSEKINIILNRIEFWLDESKAKRTNVKGFIDSVADSIKACFEGRYDDAQKIAVELETLIKNEVYRNSKMTYIFPFILLTFLMVIGSLLFNCNIIFIDWFNNFLCSEQGNESFEFFFHMATMGAIGGLFSVSYNLEKYQIEIKQKSNVFETFWQRYLLAVLLRFTIAIFSPLVLYIFLKSGFLSIDISKNNFIVYGLSVIAGFSESLIPSLITKFESNIQKGEAVRVAPATTTTPPPPANAVNTNLTPPANQPPTATSSSSGTASDDEKAVG